MYELQVPIAFDRLSAIARLRGSAVFSTQDLLRYAAQDRELAAALDGLDARRIGTWLRRLRTHAVASYVLRRWKRDGGGAVWSVTVTTSKHLVDVVADRGPC